MLLAISLLPKAVLGNLQLTLKQLLSAGLCENSAIVKSKAIITFKA